MAISDDVAGLPTTVTPNVTGNLHVHSQIVFAALKDLAGLLGATTFGDSLLKTADAAAFRTLIGAATPAQITSAIAALVNSSPTQLDTLNELATALGNDPNFATTITGLLGQKLTTPAGGSTGQVLSKTASGFEWVTPSASGASTSVTPQLAFDMPAPTNAKRVYGHYFPPYPISLDNADPASDYYETGYLAPGGEGGAHSAYGGLLRDRPTPRTVRTEADYKTANLREEVRQAIIAGLDGFLVDILISRTTTSNPIYDTPARLLNAAAAVSNSFKIVLMPDMTSAFASFTATQLKDELLVYATHPSVGRLPDGRLIIAPYYAEGKNSTYWSDFKAAMLAAGQECVLMLCFLDAGQTNQTNYASVAYGFGNWGNRNPLGNPVTNSFAGSPIDLMTKAKTAGKLWMQPVSVQDCRPNQQIYDEPENSQNLRNTWDIANQGADWIQIPTWNDYSESAGVAPSRRHGWAILDLQAYWLAKFKTGSFPTITRDALYLSHRTQPFGASPTYSGQTQLMSLRAGGSAARNLVEVVALLTDAATIAITIAGSSTTFTGAPGLNVFTVPLAPGVISATATRGGVVVQTVTTPFPATNTPYVQTLDYVYASSRR